MLEVKNLGTQNCGFLKWLLKRLWVFKIAGMEIVGYFKIVYILFNLSVAKMLRVM